MENNFSRSLLSESESRMSPDGIELGVRLPWYRSLPLSVVELAELTVDGRPVPANDIRFTINGKSFALDALTDLTEEVWYVLDSGLLTLHTAVEPVDARLHGHHHVADVEHDVRDQNGGEAAVE